MAVSKAALNIPPMTLVEIEARLALFTKWGVSEAEFFGPHLTKVRFGTTGPATDEPETEQPDADESEQDAAARRLAEGRGKVRGDANS